MIARKEKEKKEKIIHALTFGIYAYVYNCNSF